MATVTQKERTLKIDTPLGEDVLLMTGFSGTEEMSRLFRYTLQTISSDIAIKPAGIVGKSVSFAVKRADGSLRWFNGIVCRLAAGSVETGFRQYILEVVPWLWFLSRTADCRIFQNKKIPKIIEQIFQDLGFSDYETSEIKGDHPDWEYCVQYRETDLNFVSRLMEQEGIFYYFRHERGKHTLVLADKKSAYKDCPESEVEHEYSFSGQAEESTILSWDHRYEYRPGKWAQTDYDFEKPSTSLMTKASSVVQLTGVAKYEIYDYPGEYSDKSYGGSLTTLRMEEDEVPHDVASGTSTCKTFTPGGKFKIKSPILPPESGKAYVVTAVEHFATEPAGYGTGAGAGPQYSNTFTCIPDNVTFRPARLTPKPTIQGPQTAVVVGPSGEEIYTDEYGRVKVQFHWDREGTKDENSSCWIRVSQGWAGKEWGIVFHPRIGQEVIVEFLEGDPDRPIITGRVYNAEQMPPYKLPDNQTRSTIKSRSSKEGTADNFNELRFEDKKGEEEIYFHAEKDFNRVVENNDTLKVGFDKKDKGNQTIEIFNNQDITVGASECEDGSQTLAVWKDQTITIGASEQDGNQTVKIYKNQDLTVGSSSQDGSQTVTIYKDRTVELQTGNDTLNIKQGNRETTLDTGNDTLTIKTGNQTTKLNSGKSETEAMQSIELKVGANSIKIDTTGITIKGTMVKVEGSAMTEIKALMTQVKADAVLKMQGSLTTIN
jgi:type VI secretion system secreted protein VgrG